MASMSSTAIAPSSHLNGASAVSAEVLREADFLQKILQIRDDVFASKHPRIHLPAKVIEQVAPRLSQAALARPTTNGTPNRPSSQLLPPRPASSARPPTSQIHTTQRPYSAKSSSSGIDPVLLTKSEHLVKAEQQLKRQQIERALKDQFDRKGRGNDVDEREALIDVEQCLIKAHQLVPPISGLPSTANNSDGVESFDENSYYSSKADSWSPEPDHADHAHAAATPLTPQAQQTAKQVTLHTRPAEPPVIDLDEEAYEPADDIEIYEPEPAQVHEDGDEEEDYSPPPADVGLGRPPRSRGRNRNGGTNGSSRRQSPAGPAQSVQNPRKRRREERRERDERRRHQASKQVAQSPEPYIKEEPQSPPPFASYSDPQPSKRRALQPQPDDLEVVSAQASPRAQPVYYRDQDPFVRSYRELDEPSSSPTVIRTPQRKAVRDDHDLRRVASLQYARRPYSPSGEGQMYVTPETRQMRAASHAFIERAEVPPVYREASTRPSAAPRYVHGRSRSPVHEYISHGQSPMLMAPPPRRIVVDQYGNRYYAAPVDARESMAPPSRRIEVDPFYGRAVTQEPTMRAPARTELYDGEAIQRMPPPPRRYIEASEAEVIESPYRHREASRRPIEVEHRPGPQYEEMGPPREYPPARSYSMRPEGVRREIPEGYVRHESIQPVAVRGSQPRFREVSVVYQEPFEEHQYISAPQSRRYVEEGPMEVGPEAYAGEGHHVYARY